MLYLSISSIVVAILGVLVTYFGFVIKVREDIASISSTCISRAKVTDCLPQLQSDMSKLLANDAVWWQVLGPRMGEIIHSPTHIRRDTLMDEWLAAKGNIPLSDLLELRDELEQMIVESRAGDNVNLQLIGAQLLNRVEGEILALDKN